MAKRSKKTKKTNPPSLKLRRAGKTKKRATPRKKPIRRAQATKKGGRRKIAKKKSMKKKVTRAKAKKVKRVASKKPVKKSTRTQAIQAASTKAKEKLLGKVIHYYDRIGVAIVNLESPLKVGDTVLLKHGNMETTQRVSSLQIDHTNIAAAKKGDIVGVKVDREVKEGSDVLPA